MNFKKIEILLNSNEIELSSQIKSISFSKEEDLIQLLKGIRAHSNVLYTNSLNGITYRFNNNSIENISSNIENQRNNDISTSYKAEKNKNK